MRRLLLWLLLTVPGTVLAADLPALVFVRGGNLVLHDFAAGTDRPLTRDGGCGAPCWTADGQALIFARRGEKIQRLDVATGRVTTIVAGLGPDDGYATGVRAVAVHPTRPVLWIARGRTFPRGNGRVASENAIWRVGLDGQGLRKVFDLQLLDEWHETRVRYVDRIVWYPRGDKAIIAVVPDHGWFCGVAAITSVYDVTGKDVAGPLDPAPTTGDLANLPASTPALDAAGQWLAWPVGWSSPEAKRELALRIVKTATSEVAASVQLPLTAAADDQTERLTWPAFAPDGKLLAYVHTVTDEATSVHICDWRGGQELAKLDQANFPAWRPAGH